MKYSDNPSIQATVEAAIAQCKEFGGRYPLEQMIEWACNQRARVGHYRGTRLFEYYDKLAQALAWAYNDLYMVHPAIKGGETPTQPPDEQPTQQPELPLPLDISWATEEQRKRLLFCQHLVKQGSLSEFPVEE